MSLNDFLLTQTITYWSKAATLDNFGNPSFDAPVLITGRWEDKRELITDIQGKEIIILARVWSDQDVVLGGYFMNREFASGESDPIQVLDAFEIKDIRKIPDITDDEQEWIAFLSQRTT